MAMDCFNFAEDMTTEILARVPVKSLIRFKCVCKSWYDLIESPSFVSRHLNYAAASSSSNASAIIKRWDGDRDGAYVSFLSNEAEAAGELSDEVAMPFFVSDDDDDVVSRSDLVFYGPCNGVICVVAYQYSNICLFGDEIALWNPAIREIKYISASNIPHLDEYEFEHIGFGFDTRSNDYKIVRMTTFEHCYSKKPLVEIYSTITDSWRKLLDVFPPTMEISGVPSPYLNGFCYWCASDDKLVISFDFADEVFDKIPLPDIKEYCDISLVTFNDTIAFADSSEDEQFSVWVLNMKGDDDDVIEKKTTTTTWTKLYTFMYRSTTDVLGLFRGGESLILGVNAYESADELLLCDPHTQQCKKLRVYDFDLNVGSTLQMVNYVESLVSFSGAHRLHPPPADDESCWLQKILLGRPKRR